VPGYFDAKVFLQFHEEKLDFEEFPFIKKWFDLISFFTMEKIKSWLEKKKTD